MENMTQVKKDAVEELTVVATQVVPEDEQLLEQYGVLVSAEYYNFS